MNTTEPLRLVEQSTRHGVPLAQEQVTALTSYRLSRTARYDESSGNVFDITPDAMRGLYSIRTNSIVGSVAVGGLMINIVPKAGVGKAAYMLAHSLGLAHWRPDQALFEAADSIVEALIPSFLAEVARITAQGLVEDYVWTSEVGPRPKGRFDFSSMARSLMPLPVRYDYDEFTVDIPANRLIFGALLRISDLRAVTADLRGKSKQLSGAFTNVTWTPGDGIQIGEVLPDRLRHYSLALALAWLILNDAGLEVLPGALRSQTLLFDMNRVFEAYLTAILRRSCPPGHFFDPQAYLRPLHFDKKHDYRLKPDLIFWRGAECRLVGDIKYKILDDQHGPRTGDMYQAATYAQIADCRHAVLIYVGVVQDLEVRVVNTRLQIDICSIDLEAPVSVLEDRLHEIIEERLSVGPH